MTMLSILPPLSVAAKNCRQMAVSADGGAQLWSADIKLVRHRVSCRVFEGVLFMVSDEGAYILGIENPEGVPAYVTESEAQAQRDFIRYLAADCEVAASRMRQRGLAADQIIYSYDGAAQVTAAFLVEMNLDAYIVVGANDERGQFGVFRIDGERDGYFADARSTHSFDELSVA